MEINKENIRYILQFFFDKGENASQAVEIVNGVYGVDTVTGNTPTETKDDLDSVFGDSAPSFTTVNFWGAEFKRGCKSLGDDERSGRPDTSTTDENTAKIRQMVLEDLRIKVKEVTEAMNMSKERVSHILNQHLGIRKLSAHWVTLRSC
ncbi:histone-lysine N-methyltransferase SETMAR [Trichonephila clavipes]|nr:histone-lysine N-methyltransferase SETMAR [Trichonephila clavipes]